MIVADQGFSKSLENKYRDAEKKNHQDPEKSPLDQPPQGFLFFFVQGLQPF